MESDLRGHSELDASERRRFGHMARHLFRCELRKFMKSVGIAQNRVPLLWMMRTLLKGPRK